MRVQLGVESVSSFAGIRIEQDNRLQMVETRSGQTVTSDTTRAGQRAIRMAEDEALPPG
jgi:hypothetical protein